MDLGSKEEVTRHAELTKICGRLPAVHSLVINEQITFDNIPDMESLAAAVHRSIEVVK